jgi:hypothetical protein
MGHKAQKAENLCSTTCSFHGLQTVDKYNKTNKHKRVTAFFFIRTLGNVKRWRTARICRCQLFLLIVLL